MEDTCPTCGVRVPAGSRFCLTCGTRMPASPAPAGASVNVDAPTVVAMPETAAVGPGADLRTIKAPPVAAPAATSPPTTSAIVSDGERGFEPGTLLAGRYRIVALLGRGGMGEVYRADDLTLGQPVALKFLPRGLERDPGRLERFLNEIRTAREVSHPNVCRVYDVTQVDGRHFLSMEYIDGEDLASLLRRIGRLPYDKALEIARQLCAGLAAAHDKGILHRDLKPANVMLDGRGKVRLADFGLAEVAGSASGVLAGTPAYMAPEQFAGEPASVQSDIYSLGLVLYEVFTGKRAFAADSLADWRRQHEQSRPPSLTSTLHDADPAVERAIMRCLEKDPRKRPASAISVAAALPGGDPLAAALAAGETPSPDMVAAAGEEGSMRPVVAVAWLVAIAVGLAALVVAGARTSAFALMHPPDPPDALAVKASEMLARLGYDATPGDAAFGLDWDARYADYASAHKTSSARRSELATGRVLMTFWYRTTPAHLVARDFLSDQLGGGGWVTRTDPPLDEPGMNVVELDSRGRLLSLHVVAPRTEAAATTSPAVDWHKVLAETGIDPASVADAAPEWLPPTWADTRGAWTGRYPDLPGMTVRVEAAAYRGNPVFLRVVRPWERPATAQAADIPARTVLHLLSLTILIAVVAGALAIARHNLRAGRGDRRGALRLAAATVAIFLGSWLLRAHHVATDQEVILVFEAMSWTTFAALWVWVLYIALEPFVRRRWPQTLIGWSRLLAGHVHDPLVGRDILVGAAAGILIALIEMAHPLVETWWTGQAVPPNLPDLGPLLGLRLVVQVFCYYAFNGAFSALLIFFLLFLLRLVLRRDWLTAPGLVAIAIVQHTLGNPSPLVHGIAAALGTAATVLILLRFGLLALGVSTLFQTALQPGIRGFPISLDVSTWYGNPTLVAVVLLSALTLYGFRTALGRQTLLGGAAVPE